MSRPCPACRRSFEVVSGTTARCTGCGGLWLTARGLGEHGARLASDLVAVTSPRPRTCPRCAVPMSTYRSPRVEIDACDTCAGVFLDPGELEQLRAGTSPRPARATPVDNAPPALPLPSRRVPIAPGEYVRPPPSPSRAPDPSDGGFVVDALGVVLEVIFDLL